MRVFAQSDFADWQKSESEKKKPYKNSQKQLLCPNREENIGNL